MYIRRYNVYPLEVENVLAAHPAVAKISIVGLPTAVIGEIGAAFVVPADPQTRPLSATSASSSVSGCTTTSVRTNSIVLAVDELPLTAMLKVNKDDFRCRFADVVRERSGARPWAPETGGQALMSDDIRRVEQDDVLTIVFNRDSKLNALSNNMIDELRRAAADLGDRRDLSVMVIRAAGRYFTAGIDIGSMSTTIGDADGSGSALRRSYRRLHLLFDELESIEKPIVLAVHAPCYGARRRARCLLRLQDRLRRRRIRSTGSTQLGC